MHKYIFDNDGLPRQFIKEATSLTVSTDQGKGSLKAVLTFNSPRYRMGAAEAILLCLMKSREESRSLELLLESCWLLSIKNFAENLNIPIFITGMVGSDFIFLPFYLNV